MGVNNFRPHVIVLSEDDANRQILIGFITDPSVNSRAIMPMPVSDGWRKVRDDFRDNELAGVIKFPARYIVMLVDFDDEKDRITNMLEDVEESLLDRVFVLGASKEPEDLKAARLGHYEEIGKRLARDCRDNTRLTWNHEMLMHNAAELERMIPVLRPILFPGV